MSEVCERKDVVASESGKFAALREPVVRMRVINRVAILTLNRPAAINALSHEMIRELATQLEHCRTDGGIVAVVLQGAGKRGFCAGGDVHALHGMRQRNEDGWQQFLIDEYRLSYAAHTFPKPVVALLDGATIGGGMALGQAARLRVVTERTKMAMPETGIGVLPDVGAKRFLCKLPVEVELYVGLTGVVLTGAEALHFQLADVCVPSEWLGSFEERLLRIATTNVSADELMNSLRTVFEPPCNIVPYAGLGPFTQFIDRHFDRRACVDRIVGTLHRDLERESRREVRQWLQATYDAMTSSSPTMLCVTREAILRGRQMTLAECLRMELGVATRAIGEGDFSEGVRAYLIEKDRKPRWVPGTLAEIRPERVRHFLSSPWRMNSHPLADLA
ncbi:3-hydroxyisobutyryl-CoA hydrolase [Paraburkholderia sacchari]|uniref:enoyl-CoA hydratase/isomerase family protein n=1 Tax=Paraburkholderia sacchari TaxID=159450 RepID=UPI0039A4C546